MRENWPAFLLFLLLLFLLVLMMLLPKEFTPGLLAWVLMLLLIPVYWALRILVGFFASLPKRWRAEAQALDPNLSPEALLELTASCVEIPDNIALPLLLLENPNLLNELEAAINKHERERQRELRRSVYRALRRLLVFPALLLLFFLWLWLTRPNSEPPPQCVAPSSEMVFSSS